MFVKHIYIPLFRAYKSNLGLSERLVAKRLHRERWLFWKGESLSVLRRTALYPNVQNKYALLEKLMTQHNKNLDDLKYLTEVHHGVPDFLCYRQGHFKFVECKSGHEQLSAIQKICILKLMRLGYEVEVHILARACTKTRIALINLETGEKKILERQLSLRQFQKRCATC
ncbi:MAG: VRR-NUC domain-containing protein [archaeon]